MLAAAAMHRAAQSQMVRVWCAWQVERCYMLGPGGTIVDLEPSPDGAAAVVPTFAPATNEPLLNTRAAASATDRRQRMLQVGRPRCMVWWLYVESA